MLGCKGLTEHGLERDESPTFSLPSRRPGMSGFGELKCKLGGRMPCCIASNTLVTPHNPDAGSGCPMLDFTDPIRRGPVSGARLSQKTDVSEFSSSGSPALVPVPCAST